MAQNTISKELQNAILQMPIAEKDKLLLRLIRKDSMLIRQLEFQLLGDDFEMEEKKNTIKENITKYASINYSHTPGLVMMELRDWSGEITRYQKITKDKLGELELLLHLLNSYLVGYWALLNKMPQRADKLAPYVVKKAISIISKANKIHEDYHLELEEHIEQLLSLIWDYPPMAKAAQEEGLSKRWKS